MDLVHLFREGDRGVKDHCQHSRRSHTEPKLPRSENASGVERSVTLSFLLRICEDFFCALQAHSFIRERHTHRNNGVHRDLVKICD